MGKHAAKSVEDKVTLSFGKVVKNVGDKTFSLSFDPETDRFDFKECNTLVVSSCSLRDCVSAAVSRGVILSADEQKVTYKAVKSSPR